MHELNATGKKKLAEALHRKGVRALELDAAEEAVAYFRRALELRPNYQEAWNDLGVVMEALGNPHEAVKCYRNALEVRPDSVEARSNLGMLLIQLDLAQALRSQAFTSRVAW